MTDNGLRGVPRKHSATRVERNITPRVPVTPVVASKRNMCSNGLSIPVDRLANHRCERHNLCIFDAAESDGGNARRRRLGGPRQMACRGTMGRSKRTNRPVLLWIEDDTVFLQELFRVWQPDFTLNTATSSFEALSVLAECVPDLICLDLSLPHHLATVNDEEGFALLTAIRERLRLDAPIAVVTRHTDPTIRERALELGADALVTKPVKIDHLEGVLKRLLANRH